MFKKWFGSRVDVNIDMDSVITNNFEITVYGKNEMYLVHSKMVKNMKCLDEEGVEHLEQVRKAIADIIAGKEPVLPPSRANGEVKKIKTKEQIYAEAKVLADAEEAAKQKKKEEQAQRRKEMAEQKRQEEEDAAAKAKEASTVKAKAKAKGKAKPKTKAKERASAKVPTPLTSGIIAESQQLSPNTTPWSAGPVAVSEAAPAPRVDSIVMVDIRQPSPSQTQLSSETVAFLHTETAPAPRVDSAAILATGTTVEQIADAPVERAARVSLRKMHTPPMAGLAEGNGAVPPCQTLLLAEGNDDEVHTNAGRSIDAQRAVQPTSLATRTFAQQPAGFFGSFIFCSAPCRVPRKEWSVDDGEDMAEQIFDGDVKVMGA